MPEFKHKPTIALNDYAVQVSIDGKGPRVYKTPNGDLYKSITTRLDSRPKPHLEKWRKRVGESEAERIRKNATDRGIAIHDCFESYLKNKPEKEYLYKYDFFIQMLFKQMKPYLNKINNIYAQEIPLYSNHFRTAGRVDCIAEWNRILSVIDFKGSDKEKKEEWIEDYKIQAAFYAAAWYERTGMKIEQTVILVSGENTTQIFLSNPKNYFSKLKQIVEEQDNEKE